MVGDDDAWLAALGDQFRQLASNPMAGIEVSGIAAFARHVVDDVEQSVAAGIVSSVSIRSFHFCGPKASLSTFFAGAQ